VNFYAPQPGVRGQTVSENQSDSEGRFVTRMKLTLEAPYAARALWVEARGQSIQSFEIQPTQSGVHSVEKNVGRDRVARPPEIGPLRARAVHRGAGLHVLDGDAGAATPASIIAPDSRLGSGFSIGVEM
jgi:hypothetical protein